MKFDLFVAGDVLIYIGDLSNIFKKLEQKSTENSHFVFSVETLKFGSYQLNENGRFSHSQNYILRIAEEFGWHKINVISTKLRLEGNGWVYGSIYTLSRRQNL